MLKIVGVAKYDLFLEPDLGTKDLKIGGNIKGLFLHGDGRQGSEPTFVPRTPSKELLEDDGYLICFVYDKKGMMIFCIFMCNKSIREII